MKGSWLSVGWLLLASCGPEAPAKTVFELRDVVAPALAALDGCPALADIVVPTEPVPDEWIGMLEGLATETGRLHEPLLAELRQKGETSIGVLAKALGEKELSDQARRAAIETLAAIDSPAAVEVLVRALTLSHEPWIRAQCAWRLIGTKQDQFLPRILLRLRYETDEETAIWLADCAAGLGNYAGVDGVCVIRNRARTPELVALALEHLTGLAAQAGASDGDTLNRQWFSGELEARLPAPKVSQALSCEIWKCIGALGEWDLRVVDDRRFILTDMNVWVVQELAQTLHEKNVYLRIHAAQCLGRIGQRARSAGPELMASLTEPRLAPAAAAALGSLRWIEATESLEASLANARDLDFSTAAARALGDLAQARSVAPLRKAFASEVVSDVRQAAAESLLVLDPTRDVIEFLAERMTAPRTEAVSAENAIGRWLAKRKELEPARNAPVLEEWLALDPNPQGEIATREQVDARLDSRAKLVKTRVVPEIR